MDYAAFLDRKQDMGASSGFEPIEIPGFLFDFQRDLVEWAIRKGRAAVLASCGLGKTPMGLVWASNVVRKTGKPVLYLTPVAVGPQTVREAEKFGIEAYAEFDKEVYIQVHGKEAYDKKFGELEAIGQEGTIWPD